MTQIKILILSGLIGMVVSCAACSDSGDDNGLTNSKKYPLTALAVKVGDSYYHGKINQQTGIVEIGTIRNGYTITGIEYTLLDENATISPDPDTFLYNWKKEQQVTVTTADNIPAIYTIVFTMLDDEAVEIVFEDNFDVDGTPDPSKWVLCFRGTSDWNDEMSESYDQAYVKDGKLILVAEKVDGEYKAGGIKTEGKFAFTFGKVEVRARITKYPNGAFPAIWMMPQKYIYPGWPDCGEIDIMEHVKQEVDIHQTLHTHYTYTLGMKTEYPSSTTVVCNFAEYNVYGMEWTPEELIFSVNGQVSFSYPNLHLPDEPEKMQWPFTQDSAFYLILNMGLGGDREGSWAGPVDENNLPAVMEIDWVRISKTQ